MRMRRCWECGMWYWQALKNAAEEAIDQKTKSPAGSSFVARLSDHKPPFNKIRTPSDVYQDTATPYLIFYTDKAPSIMFQSGQQLNSEARLSGSNLTILLKRLIGNQQTMATKVSIDDRNYQWNKSIKPKKLFQFGKFTRRNGKETI